MRIAALASHGGSILQAVIDAIENHTLDASLVLVISNNSRARALQRAARHAIPTLHLSGKTHPDPVALDEAIASALTRCGCDLVLLAGYMKRLGPVTLRRFDGRIINTHPALLPKHGGQGHFGRRVHEAVLAAGERVSGATVHWVDGDYDSGAIIAQSRVPVKPDDTAKSLEDRVKVAERKLVVESLAELAHRTSN